MVVMLQIYLVNIRFVFPYHRLYEPVRLMNAHNNHRSYLEMNAHNNHRLKSFVPLFCLLVCGNFL